MHRPRELAREAQLAFDREGAVRFEYSCPAFQCSNSVQQLSTQRNGPDEGGTKVTRQIRLNGLELENLWANSRFVASVHLASTKSLHSASKVNSAVPAIELRGARLRFVLQLGILLPGTFCNFIERKLFLFGADRSILG